MRLWAFLLLLLGSALLLSLLWVNPVNALDTAASMSATHDLVLPAVTWATNWGTKVGFGIVGAQLFYTIVIRLVKD